MAEEPSFPGHDGDYLQKFPDIDREGFAKYAGFASDTVDARLGEMNKDRIFWNATAKRMSSAALISYSYTLGTAKQILGPAYDAARLPDRTFRKAAGTLPYGEQVWTPRLSFAIATGLGIGLINSTYQYLMTGKPPENAQDVWNAMARGPKTGGVDPSTGQPERARIPQFFNSFMNFWNGPQQEIWNKVNPLWKTIWEASRNTNWMGKPNGIYNPNEPITKKLGESGDYVGEQLGSPIVFGNIEGAKGGTHIGFGQRLAGIRAAGMKRVDPEGLKRKLDFKDADATLDRLVGDYNKRRAQQGFRPSTCHTRSAAA